MTGDDYRAYLNGVELGARMIARNVHLMPRRPDFETNAEVELSNARQVLTEALESVIKAQGAYQLKPADA